MRHYPSLPEIVAAVETLLLPKRKKAPQGRKPCYSDELIIALAVYQHLWRFRYAQDLLYWLRTHGHQVPAPSTFCERKAQLLGQMILAVKALAGLYNPAPCLRMDSNEDAHRGPGAGKAGQAPRPHRLGSRQPRILLRIALARPG